MIGRKATGLCMIAGLPLNKVALFFYKQKGGDMKTIAIKSFVVLGILFPVTSCFITVSLADENAMSGMAKMTVVKKEVVPVGDTEGHVLVLSEAQGSNTNTGDWVFMDGADCISRTQLDLIKGNGVQNGYFIMSKDGNQTIVKYEGVVKTVLSPENKPLISFKGTWAYYKCSGIYEGCQGQGGYNGKYISEIEYIAEFNGLIDKK